MLRIPAKRFFPPSVTSSSIPVVTPFKTHGTPLLSSYGKDSLKKAEKDFFPSYERLEIGGIPPLMAFIPQNCPPSPIRRIEEPLCLKKWPLFSPLDFFR